MRVVIADDVMLTREGIARVLAAAGAEVVGEAGDVDGLMRAVATQKPDCAIVDIRMPPTNTDEGIVAAQRIRELHPGVGVLVLSQYVEPGYQFERPHDAGRGSQSSRTCGDAPERRAVHGLRSDQCGVR